MIYIGADHGGFSLKQKLLGYLKSQKQDVKDCGNTAEDANDNFTDFVLPVVKGVLSGDKNKGILICGTGIGVSIAANHCKGIRAALVNNEEYAALSRKHNDANVLCLGGRFIDYNEAVKILDIFLTTDMDCNPKYKNRMNIADGSI